jgi:NAD(P)-dependent dehydrogenase (short-subunit alcohol dehydrogenase family)
MTSDVWGLQGKVAVIFGCASGIGAASAAALARSGAKVVMADVALEAVRAAASSLEAEGAEVVPVACDVGQEADISGAIDLAVDRFGRLDVVHNNAAAMHLASRDGRVGELDTGLWDESLRINLRGQLLGCKHAVRVMGPEGGSIINTGSASGLVGDVALSAYGIGKAGTVQLSRMVAVQYGRRLIRCNTIVPGLIDVKRKAGTGMRPEQRSRMMAHQVLPVSGQPEDIADAVLFLAGDRSRFMTGAVLTVDGGISIHMPTYADSVALEQDAQRDV